MFDFDGVLADTEPVHCACWSRILEPFGVRLDWSYYEKECIGVSDRLMIERLAAARMPPVAFEDIWAEYERKKELFRQTVEREPPFRDDTLKLVRNLSSSYKLAVVSSSGRLELEPPITRAGIRDCFQALVCGREAQNLKPAPDPYLLAADLLGAQCPLVVEDSEAGVMSARAAGFDVLQISNTQAMPREVLARLTS
jgi:HAD superfamily hydrolase (TIGR01509 family)